MTTMMSAALPATALVHPIDPIGVMPRGLTDTDGELIAAAIAAARTESTRHVYAGVWSRWERWCAGLGVAVLPGDPLAVCAYLVEQAADGRAMGTLDLVCTVIRHVHLTCDLGSPTDDALAARQVRRGLRRTYGAAPMRLARPLSVEEIRQIIVGIDRTTPIGIRDAAIILLGYASALRRSELVALTLTDIEDKPAGLMLHVRRSKTDPEGHGEVVRPRTTLRHRPRRRAQRLARHPRRITRPGLTRIWSSTVSLQPLSGPVPARMLRARAEAAGLDGTRITAHSMRAGHATTAALAGVPLDRIAAQTRHKDL